LRCLLDNKSLILFEINIKLLINNVKILNFFYYNKINNKIIKMSTITSKSNQQNLVYKLGYLISLFGIVIILLWIGIFKFTPTEAQGIKKLVENHFLTFFIYEIMSIQTVSNIIGAIEITLGLILLVSLKFRFLRKYAAIGIIVTFLTTLSYLFTTPGTWKIVDGIPITDFFILKDIMFLGFGLMILNSKNE